MPVLFQRLPWDIAHLIAYYVTDESQSGRLIKSRNLNKESNSLSPLLQASRTWRSVAFARVCHVYNINLAFDFTLLDAKYSLWPAEKNYIYKTKEYFAKVVEICLDFNRVISGESLETLNASHLHKTSFPGARTVCFYIEYYNYNYIIDAAKAVESVDQFCNALDRLLPAVNTINVVIEDVDLCEQTSAHYAFNYLVCALSCGKRIDTLDILSSSLPVSLTLKPIENLTTLKCVWDQNHEQTTRLIRRNMQSLRNLEINIEVAYGLDALVNDGYSELVYPQLEQLCLTSLFDSALFQLGYKTTGILFPSLRHIDVDCNYPFADDTLFRGNSHTLEYLHITPDPQVLDMLISYGVFNCKRNAKLSNLSLGIPSNISESFKLEESVIEKILKSTPNALHTLEIPSGYTFNWSATIPKQMLEIPCSLYRLATNGYFSILDIVGILKQQPTLVELTCNIEDYSIFSSSWEQKAKQLDLMYKTHYPVSTNFKHWIDHTGGRIGGRSIAAGAIFLAILCPSFSYADIQDIHKFEVNDCILDAIEEKSFEKHAERLKSILYYE